jgi:DNA-binding IclR family transcriptional regulator
VRNEVLSGTKSIDTALALLKESLTSGKRRCVSDIAESLGLPIATAYRHLAALKRQGLVRRVSGRSFAPGAFLLSLFDQEAYGVVLGEAARPVLLELAGEMRATSHLGVLQNEMVTYVVKAEVEDHGLFSRENAQLDAYCSGLGKVLLAWLTEEERESYLTGGEFVPLTCNTIVTDDLLRRELLQIRQQGFAVDNEEFERNLFCVAVPVFETLDRVIAAISISGRRPDLVGERRSSIVRALTGAATEIRKRLYNV